MEDGHSLIGMSEINAYYSSYIGIGGELCCMNCCMLLTTDDIYNIDDDIINFRCLKCGIEFTLVCRGIRSDEK